MNELRRLWVVIPAMVLAGLLVVLFLARGTMEQLSFLRRGGVQDHSLVDERPAQTAQTLAGMAVSVEEQGFAQEAQRLADHEVDQAFAMALRKPEMQVKTLTGSAGELAARVDALKQMVKQDQGAVDAATAAAKAAGSSPSEGDDLDVAKAQLGLDNDELADAQADLAQATGDQRGKIQQQLAAREAALKKIGTSGVATGETAVAAVRRHATLWGRATAWFEQRNRVKLLAQAEDKANEDAKTLTEEHNALERAGTAAGLALPTATGPVRVKLLQAMSARRVVMSILDDRVQTQEQLASVYARWQTQVWVQHRILGYLVLESMAWVTLIMLLVAVARLVGRRVVDRVARDPRQAHTLKTILTLGLEVLGLLAILLLTFGAPQQTPTILGLATAGLTVVFQDYILAFFGWFVLMGKHGIRVSDWVEIDSVGGEVAEVGLFRTVLLETGNWTSRGHPTGRRITFINSFAIRGQYFNFSTHGQWMWDEITLNVPATANAYEVIQRMQTAVEEVTADNTRQATEEWAKATSDVSLRLFSAKPTVELRPAAAGVDVIVRFVTKASERFDLRNRIFTAMLGLMEGTERPGLKAAD